MYGSPSQGYGTRSSGYGAGASGSYGQQSQGNAGQTGLTSSQNGAQGYGQSSQYGQQESSSRYPAGVFGGNSMYGGTYQQQINAHQQQRQQEQQSQSEQRPSQPNRTQSQAQAGTNGQGQLARQQSQSQLQRNPSSSGNPAKSSNQNPQSSSQPQNQQSDPQQQQQQQNSRPPTTEERTLFHPLQEIASTLREVAEQDERAMVGSGGQGPGGLEGTLAGLNVSNNYSFPDLGANNEPFKKERSIQLPQALFMKLQRTKQGRQGLLPDIQRAWFGIDDHLYLWDYSSENNQRLDACEHTANGPIESVGLLKADPNIFTSDIHYLLVIATRQHVVVLGLNYGSSENTVTLVDTGIKATNSTGQAFTQIAGSSSSRIFLCGGQDGCLYELAYNASQSGLTSWIGLGGPKDYLRNWSSSSGMVSMMPLSVSSWVSGSRSASLSPEDTVSIAVDSNRKCLYALTRGSGVHLYVYDGRDQLRLVCTNRALLKKAQSEAMNSSLFGNSARIVAIQVIGPEESNRMQLLAVTEAGARLYITHSRTGYGAIDTPAVLEVMHTRLPMTPMPDNKGGPFRPDAMVNTLPQSRYLSGVFIAVVGESEKTSASYLLHAPDTMRALSAGALPESVQGPRINGSVYVSAVAECPSPLSDSSRIQSYNRLLNSHLELHELITEVTTIVSRRILILAQDGLETWVKARPVDMIRRVIMSQDKAFFENQIAKGFEGKAEQLCAILVSLLVRTKVESTTDGKDAQLCATIGEIASDYLTRTALTVPGGGSSYNGVTPRLRGLMIHVSRVQRRFWRLPVTRLVANPNIQDVVIQPTVLREIQQELLAIEAVMTQRHIFFDSTNSTVYAMYNRGAEANDGSRKWEQLRTLIRQSIEAISFVLLLVENKLQVTVARSPPETQQQLLNMSYGDLISTSQGRQTARALVSTLMNQQLGQQISIETISDTLQNRCGSFCNADDVILYKAMESIRKARSCRSVADRETYLHESLQLYIRGSSSMTVEKVVAACEEFRSLDYPAGCIELPLECAQRRDPHNAAYHTASETGKSASQARSEYYQVVLDTLAYYDHRLDETHGTGAEQNALSARSRIYEHALNVTDALFCGRLYEWMLERGRDEELLQLDNDTILDFLRMRKPVDSHKDLLWKYYARREQHLASALALSELVGAVEIPLNERVEHLANAVSQARSSSLQPESAPVDFITELEEKAEVANIQMAIYAEIERGVKVDEMEKDSVLNRLGEKFFNVTELYNEFAEPLKMYSAMLALYNASSHEDQNAVELAWDGLVEEALEGQVEQQRMNVSALLVEMGRRFYPSPYAMPPEIVIPLMITTAYIVDVPEYHKDQRVEEGQVTEWLLRAFVEGNVPLRDVWEVLYEFSRDGVPPFETIDGSIYIELQIRLLIRMWLDEHDRQIGYGYGGGAGGGGGRKDFPVTAVDGHIQHWLVHNDTNPDPRMRAIAGSYREIGDEMRRRFGGH